MMRQSTNSQGRSALRIALLYAIISILWIFFSDLLLVPFRGTRLITTLSIIKGWIYVIITALLLYSLVNRAVSRIRTAEAQMQLLFESVDDAIFVFRPGDGLPGNFVNVNEAGINRTGYSKAELLKMSPLDLIKPELLPEARAAAERLREPGQVVFETVVLAKDGHEIPVEVSARVVAAGPGGAMGVAIARDITERRRAEAERRGAILDAERDKRRFYKETILAVTGGKFEICDPGEVACLVPNPGFVTEFSRPEQVSEVRRETIAYCRSQGLSEDLAREFELAVGEALANAVKHAGGGELRAGRRNVHVWVAVIDHGRGIDTFAIPRVALMPGFTTTASMGLGYTIMLEICDRVRLATGPTGTTVILEKRLKPVSDIERRISIHGGIK